MFRGDVRPNARIASQCSNRSVVDDRTAALAFHLPELVLHATPQPSQIDPDHSVPFLAGAVGSWEAPIPWLFCAFSNTPAAMGTLRNTVQNYFLPSLPWPCTREAILLRGL